MQQPPIDQSEIDARIKDHLEELLHLWWAEQGGPTKDRDLQIVKTYGKGVGRLKKGEDNQFPKFETYREQVDNKYWFPVFTQANDTLHFQSGPQPIKMIVKYEDYKQFKAESNIQFGEQVNENKDQKEKPNPNPPKQ